MKLKDIFKSIIMEVRIIDPKKWVTDQTPILDTDVIRVYHGFSGNAKVYPSVIANFGLSGKVRANRTYSYEVVNNPKGLFVSVDFDTVKKNFAGSGVIIEFHARVSDLEAPTWNSDTGRFFVQGDYTKGFSTDDERDVRKRLNRGEFSKSEYPAIARSDSPDIAYWLLYGAERQALFIGDLNPNMIRAFWVNDDLMNGKYGGTWERLSRTEFLKRYPAPKYPNRHTGKLEYPEEFLTAKGRVFKPNDDFNIQPLADEFELSTDRLLTALEEYSEQELLQLMWPKQVRQYMEKYRK